MILALDCATKTGWCLLKDGKVYESGVQDFSKTRGESNGAMFLKFQEWLKRLWFSGVATDIPVDREKLAWAAGFFDGEGHIGCTTAYRREYVKQDGDVTTHTSDRLAMQISQVDRGGLERFLDAVGGLGSIEGPYDDGREHSQPISMWRVSGVDRVERVVCLLWPWLGKVKRCQAEDALGRKIANIDRTHTIHPTGLIVYEGAHHRGGAATEICVNMTGRLQEFAVLYALECVSVHTGTLKKFATGSGAASKEKMIELAAVVLRRQPQDDNEADAVHLALWAFHEYGVR